MTTDANDMVVARPGDDLDAAVAEAGRRGSHLAVVDDVHVPSGVLERLGQLLDDDSGIGSVSLLDRAALGCIEAVSSGDDGPAAPDLGDAEIRARLAAADLAPASIAEPVGPVVVLGRGALSRIPELPEGPDAAARVAAWSTLAGQRAFCHLLDLRTLVACAGDEDPVEPEPVEADTALRVKVALRGIRLQVDGRTFAFAETGSEVHTLHLIGALARRPEVASIAVNLRGAVPPFAAAVLSGERIRVFEQCGEWDDALPPVDVFHRPYQPISPDDVGLWRANAARTLCDMQDLITFLSPEYHRSRLEWIAWRQRIRGAVAAVDGVFTVSEHVRRQVLREGLRGDADLVWAAGNGVDHVEPGAPSVPPPELATAAGRRFALVLGSTYGHKNVDLAAHAIAAVRARGRDVLTVTAGLPVPGHAQPPPEADEIRIGRSVGSAERNWLLANAAAVVIATSAEGFGLVPFEAAAYGTPSVSVRFGAVAEVLGPVPVSVDSWSVAELADAIDALVTDGRAAAVQVACIQRAGRRHTWDRTAGIVVRGYEAVLARPARR